MLRPLSSAGPAHQAQGETATSRGANSPGPVDGSGPSLAVLGGPSRSTAFPSNAGSGLDSVISSGDGGQVISLFSSSFRGLLWGGGGRMQARAAQQLGEHWSERQLLRSGSSSEVVLSHTHTLTHTHTHSLILFFSFLFFLFFSFFFFFVKFRLW